MTEYRWEETNDALRHRGLHPITMTAATELGYLDAVSTSNVAIDDQDDDDKDKEEPVVVVEKKSLAAIQETLHRLMDDCDRRQGLITDLIRTNNGLRDELRSAKERRPSSSSTTPLASFVQANYDEKKRSSTLKLNSVNADDGEKSERTDGFDSTNVRNAGGDKNPSINSASAGGNDNVDAVLEDGDRNDDGNGYANQNNNNDADVLARDKCSRFSKTPVTAFPPDPRSADRQTLAEKEDEADGRAERTDRELQDIKRRLMEIEKEESRRRMRCDAIFRQIRKRPARKNDPNDGKVLDVIDFYEREIDRIAGQKDSSADDAVGGHSAPLTYQSDADAATLNSNGVATTALTSALTRKYDRQLREADTAMKKWKNEMRSMKEELDSRPSRLDFQEAQSRISELQRLLVETQRQNSLRAKRGSRDDNNSPLTQSGSDEAVLCLDKLKSRLGVTSSLDVVDKVDFLCRALVEGRKAEKLLKKIDQVIDGGEEGHKLWCHSSGLRLLQTLKRWKSDLNEIPKIHHNVAQLRRRLMGVDESSAKGETQSTKELIAMTEALLKDNSLPSFDSVRKIDDANQQTMILIISHFQNLFDVDEVPNVITRMNDVYNKMKEIQNILRTLREILGLDDKAPAGWAVVDAVAQLTNALNASSTRRLQEVLGVGNLESVVNAVGEHRDFCPVFTRVLQKVMEVLVVDSLDKVLPAIHSLKLLATPAPLHEDDDRDDVAV